MPDRSRKRLRDPNQLGKLVVDLATGEAEEQDPHAGKDPPAMASGVADHVWTMQKIAALLD